MSDFSNFNFADVDAIIDNVFQNRTNTSKCITSNNALISNFCPSCKSHDNFMESSGKGIVVCKKCGCVIENLFCSGLHKRADKNDNNQSVRSNVLYNTILPQQSSIVMQIRRKYKYTNDFRGKNNYKFRRNQSWNPIPYKARSLMAIFKNLHRICAKHNIIKKIEDDAQIICCNVSSKMHMRGKNKGKPIITRGKNRKGMIASTLFVACRRNGDTRSIKEIASYWGIGERDINKGLKSLLSILIGDDVIHNTGTSKVVDFIRRKCMELGITLAHTDVAIKIATNIDKLNAASNHTTYSLAAASILLTANMHAACNVTRKMLSESFSVSDVTIGKAYAQIDKYKNILIDDNVVSKILKMVESKKRKLVIRYDVWKQMVRFGIDTSAYIIDNESFNKALFMLIEKLDIHNPNYNEVLHDVDVLFTKIEDDFFSTSTIG